MIQPAYGEEIIENDRNTFRVTETGGYVTGWSVINEKTGKPEEIFYRGTSLQRTGIPPLFPAWGVSGTTLRRHGFTRDSKLKLTVDKLKSTAVMTLDSRDITGEIGKEYPNDFLLEIDIKTSGRNLFYVMSVVNRGKEEMVISPALHPYFFINHRDKSKIKTENIPGFDAKKFDWDRIPPDNDYPFNGQAKIMFPGRTITVTDESSPRVIRHIVVWSQTPEKDDFDFICFEPVTGLTGSIQKKETVVRPGHRWKMNLRLSVSFG